MRKFILLLLLHMTAEKLYSQTISGQVFSIAEGREESLPGVLVYWKGSTSAAVTDTLGVFSISYPQSFPALLMISSSAYRQDSLLVEGPEKKIKIRLSPAIQLQTISVEARRNTTQYSIFKPINTEVISGRELLKAACCNLSESFSTNASVDVAFTDAVSGAKKIQMLGLDGVYTQVLSENLPMLRGLSSSYALSYIPGSWIENILVTKGTGSVVNGYESISGQINLEFLKPAEQKHRIFLNLYGNHKGRMEGNLHLTGKLNENWSSMLFNHISGSDVRQDMNKDGFLDMPLLKQYNFFNRWDYNNGRNREAQFGIKALYESRQGGQTKFNYKSDRGTENAYGIGIITEQLEFFSKTGFLFPKNAGRSIGIQTSVKWQRQNMFFGKKAYNGEENTFYLNAIYADILGSTDHKYKAGFSYLLDDFDEIFNDSAFYRTEHVPGIFAEYTFTHDENISIVAGLREDFHSLAGAQFSPRLHVRYMPLKKTTLRLSAGKGFRTSNVIIENQSVFASSRTIIFQETLLPEIAWNYGISANQGFIAFGREAFINIDFFRTDFVNQVIADLDQHVNRVVFYNLKGESRSHSLQTDFGFSPLESFDIKLAYKWYDVKTTYNYELLDKPYIPKHRIMVNMAYATYREIWKFDGTVNWMAPARLPSTKTSPLQYQLPEYGDDYFLLNAQITKKFRRFEIYIGGENILNYMQKNPVIAADDPFGSHFDASMIYAPVEGAIVYSGIRLLIK